MFISGCVCFAARSLGPYELVLGWQSEHGQAGAGIHIKLKSDDTDKISENMTLDNRYLGAFNTIV